MIWTVVLWLGMQGHMDSACAQTPPSFCFYKGCEKMAVEIDGGCPVLPTTPGIDPNMTTPPKNYMMPPNLMESVTPNAPTEHVFEIRTKRERVSDCDGAYVGEDGCFRITRELWMDGKRLGIIKGLD